MAIKNLKKSNGFAASDALIAILIITLVTGIIANLLYNIYLSNASLKRMSKANGYIVDVFEYVDKIYYDEVSEKGLITYFNNKYYYQADGTTPKEDAEAMAESNEGAIDIPFKVVISTQNYNQTEGNTNKLDLVKEIEMTVKYKLGNKEQEITVKRIKSREKLISINQPDLDLLNLEEGQYLYPIKNIENNYVVCNENDSNWYNYENKESAKVLISNKTLEIGYGLTDQDTLVYQWIPRYAENSQGNIKYLYSNTNKYVAEQEGYQKLVDLEEGYTVNSSFINSTGEETIQLVGIWEEV